VRKHRFGQQVGERGRRDRQQHPLADERLEFGTVGVVDVRVEPAGARFRNRALQYLFRARAPDLRFDAVLALERIGHDFHVVDRRRRVERQFAFTSRRIDELLHAIRAGVGDRRRRLRGRERGDDGHRQRNEDPGEATTRTHRSIRSCA
jgi:hypothetical protein